METPSGASQEVHDLAYSSIAGVLGWNSKIIDTYFNMARATQTYWSGVVQYLSDFMSPSWTTMASFSRIENEKAPYIAPWQNAEDFLGLLLLNIQLASMGAASSIETMADYHTRQRIGFVNATLNTLFGGKGDDIVAYTDKQAQLLDLVINVYPKAIRDIKSEYGLHLDNGGYDKIAETERFDLYQVLPLDGKTKVKKNGKPVLIIPPYVLGANILAFLPSEGKSYVHAFANQGIPTYLRLVKDIDTTPAVQLMRGEDDALDTRYFCEAIMARSSKPVTLNGFCQGGYVSVVNLLSGELDGLVDALVTCVAPMDGSRSKALVEYIQHLPPRFRDLGYAEKTLPNGNQVVDGHVMSWVFKLKTMDKEAPLLGMYRDLMMFNGGPPSRPFKISKTAAAINHWMMYDRKDLPAGITQMSFQSYTNPVESDGTLPVTLFGRSLNFKRIKEKGIKWLTCIAEKDDLIDEAAALAALPFVDAEVSVFPKGHGAIATSWSLATSECALHTYFSGKSEGKPMYRGPVRFQLDLDKATPVSSKTA